VVPGFDRDRVFYPTLLIVIATYYILFAVIGSSPPALTLESLIPAAFLALAVAGFKKNLWLIVAALAGHGVFDFYHHLFIQNPGVPVWWPVFCLSFDVLAGGFLAILLMRRLRIRLEDLMDSASVEVFRLQNMKSTEPNWPLILSTRNMSKCWRAPVPYGKPLLPSSLPRPHLHFRDLGRFVLEARQKTGKTNANCVLKSCG
jgi:hypothetical protein